MTDQSSLPPTTPISVVRKGGGGGGKSNHDLDWFDFQTRMRKLISQLLEPTVIRTQQDKNHITQIRKNNQNLKKRIDELEFNHVKSGKRMDKFQEVWNRIRDMDTQHREDQAKLIEQMVQFRRDMDSIKSSIQGVQQQIKNLELKNQKIQQTVVSCNQLTMESKEEDINQQVAQVNEQLREIRSIENDNSSKLESHGESILQINDIVQINKHHILDIGQIAKQAREEVQTKLQVEKHEALVRMMHNNFKVLEEGLAKNAVLSHKQNQRRLNETINYVQKKLPLQFQVQVSDTLHNVLSNRRDQLKLFKYDRVYFNKAFEQEVPPDTEFEEEQEDENERKSIKSSVKEQNSTIQQKEQQGDKKQGNDKKQDNENKQSNDKEVSETKSIKKQGSIASIKLSLKNLKKKKKKKFLTRLQYQESSGTSSQSESDKKSKEKIEELLNQEEENDDEKKSEQEKKEGQQQEAAKKDEQEGSQKKKGLFESDSQDEIASPTARKKRAYSSSSEQSDSKGQQQNKKPKDPLEFLAQKASAIQVLAKQKGSLQTPKILYNKIDRNYDKRREIRDLKKQIRRLKEVQNQVKEEIKTRTVSVRGGTGMGRLGSAGSGGEFPGDQQQFDGEDMMDSGSNRMGGFGGGIGSGRFNRPSLLGSGRKPSQAAGFFQRGNNSNTSPKKNLIGQQQSPSIFKKGSAAGLEKIKAGEEEEEEVKEETNRQEGQENKEKENLNEAVEENEDDTKSSQKNLPPSSHARFSEKELQQSDKLSQKSKLSKQQLIEEQQQDVIDVIQDKQIDPIANRTQQSFKSVKSVKSVASSKKSLIKPPPKEPNPLLNQQKLFQEQPIPIRKGTASSSKSKQTAKEQMGITNNDLQAIRQESKLMTPDDSTVQLDQSINLKQRIQQGQAPPRTGTPDNESDTYTLGGGIGVAVSVGRGTNQSFFEKQSSQVQHQQQMQRYSAHSSSKPSSSSDQQIKFNSVLQQQQQSNNNSYAEGGGGGRYDNASSGSNFYNSNRNMQQQQQYQPMPQQIIHQTQQQNITQVIKQQVPQQVWDWHENKIMNMVQQRIVQIFEEKFGQNFQPAFSQLFEQRFEQKFEQKFSTKIVEHVDERLNEVNEYLDSRFGDIEQQFQTFMDKFDQLEQKMIAQGEEVQDYIQNMEIQLDNFIKKKHRASNDQDAIIKEIKEKANGANQCAISAVQHLQDYTILFSLIFQHMSLQNSLDRQDHQDRRSIALMGYRSQNQNFHNQPLTTQLLTQTDGQSILRSSLHNTSNNGPMSPTGAGLEISHSQTTHQQSLQQQQNSLIVNPGPNVIGVEKKCLSCSGQLSFVMSSFKMACLSYAPSPVMYRGRVYPREDMYFVKNELTIIGKDVLRRKFSVQAKNINGKRFFDDAILKSKGNILMIDSARQNTGNDNISGGQNNNNNAGSIIKLQPLNASVRISPLHQLSKSIDQTEISATVLPKIINNSSNNMTIQRNSVQQYKKQRNGSLAGRKSKNESVIQYRRGSSMLGGGQQPSSTTPNLMKRKNAYAVNLDNIPNLNQSSSKRKTQGVFYK